jgi:hypothetical protein
MERNTRLSESSEKRNWSTVTVVRLMVTALLFSALVSVALKSSMHAQIESQLSYRSATFSAGSNPSAAKIGDLDGDGLNDIAVVNLQGSLQLFFNNGAGSFQRVSLNGLWPSSSSTLDVDIGDLNGDGKNDIAVAFSTQSGSVSVLFNQGNRTFAAPVSNNLCKASNGVAIGDLDRDGDNDLADISQCSKAGILLNSGQGSFAFNGVYGDGYASRSIALADFNGDGFKDIAYINNGLGSSKPSTIAVVLNNGNATFGPPAWVYIGDGPEELTAGDFDGDGDADIAVAVPYIGEIWIMNNNGNGSFGSGSYFPGGEPSSITSADLNGDGPLDLAVTSRTRNILSVLINQGNYSFSGQTFNVGQSPADVAAGKLDGDSLPDLVAVNQGSGSITVLFSADGAPPPPPPSSQITLTASTRTTKTSKLVDLRWSGATSSSVDIYRNGSRIATVSNTGSYTDQLNKRAAGTYTYKVCVAGGQECSNQPAVTF